MSTKNITIRIDEDLKEASEKLFEALGFNMTTSITAFIKQVVRELCLIYGQSFSRQY